MLLRFAVPISLCFAAISLFLGRGSQGEVITCSGIVPMKRRSNRISITEFGGVGDGRTLNTKAFREAIYQIQHLKRRGGTLLHIPSGVYLTESFNLTSHMTLYLAKNAVIKATQDARMWPLISPLPSYGRGRELPGGRFMSFIHASGVEDVIITGENGTIDGQGDVWWNMWRRRTLRFTRPHLIEFVHSRDIIISYVTFQNSPFWNIHPVYCSNVVIQFVTILAPRDSPNTDGVDPDSCSNICIEDSYIAVGDDLVAVKSGWDEYGIAYNLPSTNITVRRLAGSSPFSGFAIGSETSGGVHNILAETLRFHDMGLCVHIKTNTGRGGTVRNVTVSDVYCATSRKGIKVAGDVGGHPDEGFNPAALPVVRDVFIKGFWGVRVQLPGAFQGLKLSPFTGIRLLNVTVFGVPGQKGDGGWKCSDVSGAARDVRPPPCSELASIGFLNLKRYLDP